MTTKKSVKAAPKAEANESQITSLSPQRVRALAKQLEATGPGGKHPDPGERVSMAHAGRNLPQEDEYHPNGPQSNETRHHIQSGEFSPTQLAQLVEAFQRSVPQASVEVFGTQNLQTPSGLQLKNSVAWDKNAESAIVSQPATPLHQVLDELDDSIAMAFTLSNELNRMLDPVSYRRGYDDAKEDRPEPIRSPLEYRIYEAKCRMDVLAEELRRTIQELRI